MCFLWLKKLYRCLRAKCAHRRRGYSRDISLHHGGFCSGSFSDPLGRASFSCGREGSVTYTRRPSYSPRPSYCPPVPASPPYSVSGGYTCGGGGSVVIPGGGCGGTAGWGGTGGTVPVYAPRGGGGDWGHSLGGEGGSTLHPGDLGGGSGYGFPAPPSDASAGGGTGGPGYYSGGSGYAPGGVSGPELSPGGGGCSQVLQQKCPVVVPSTKSQQCKQKSHWPPGQKK
ncbi:keratin, type I cytoskeletal 9-like [Pseudopipra pipra]|uniref:keratin, type I cytoskeletal 9-like n=1 Tax=Pseudopipra pipra TaxID=415032 RepID=UPI003138673F